MVRRPTIALLVAFLAMPPARAWADQPNESGDADALYKEAITLIAANRYADACPKLEQSQRLDPGLGTEFHLANCYEHVGKLGTAFEAFRKVANAARAADKQKLARLADERQNALRERVPRLVITFARPEPTADVLIDGVRASSNEWTGDGLPIDPGKREVEVRIVGKPPWHASPTASEREVVNLRVDAVELSPPASSERATPPPVPGRSLRPIGAVTAGVGLVVTAVGVTAGVLALQRRDDARAACGDDDPKRCHNQGAVGEWDTAVTTADVSTVALVAGGALLGAGVVLWVLGSSKPKVTARADAYGGRLGLEGHW